MAKIDKTYHDLIANIKRKGFKYEDPRRKGIQRIQIPTASFYHKFEDGFPAITTKKLFWKGIVGELIWFLRGSTNIKYLVDNNIHIWDKDSKNFSDNGDVGRIYGAQWRSWKLPQDKDSPYFARYDQLLALIYGLRKAPMSTQHIVTAWNPAELEGMALPPCHWSFEILVEPLKNQSKELPSEVETDGPTHGFTLKWHQRSVDTFLGLPFNIASYALLAHIIAELTNMVPLAIEGDLSNVHLYEPHLPAVNEQLSRSTNMFNSETSVVLSENFKNLCASFKEGDITLDDVFDSIDIDDFTLTQYTTLPAIKAEMFARDN